MKQFVEALLANWLRWWLNLLLGVVGFFLGDPPENANGASLDPDLHAFVTVRGPFSPEKLTKYGLDWGRSIGSFGMRVTGPEAVKLPSVEDRVIDGPASEIPVRLYDPEPGAKLPGCVFYHGGGFVVGDLDSHDGFCRLLAREANCRVVAVDYRLAPEHHFPAAVEDAVAAFQWVHDHARELRINRDRIAVAGDSAGATLSTVVCQHRIKRDRKPSYCQLLLYPPTDMVEDYPSRYQEQEQILLPWRGAEWFGEQYLSGTAVDDLEDHRVSPLQFDALDKTPPAIVATAGFDPLRDEGLTYVRQLKSNGVDVRHHHYDHLFHGFMSFAGISEASKKATRELVSEVGEMVNGTK